MPTFKVRVESSLTGEANSQILDVNIEPSSTVEDLKTILTLNGVNCDPDVNKFIIHINKS